MCRVVYIAVLVGTLINYGDCFEFDKSYGNIVVYANNSKPVTFKWKYNLGNSLISSVTIQCGYVDSGLSFIPVIRKEANNPPQQTGSNTISGRVNVYTEQNVNNIIGFTITSARKTDPINYKCRTSFQVSQGQSTKTADSRLRQLVVLDPPNLDRCLSRAFSSINYNEDLAIECIVTGNPTPNLLCELLDYNYKRLATLPSNGTPRPINYTQNEGTFSKISKYATYVRCTASQEKTGSINKTREVPVKHTPFAPANFSQIGSSDTRSIRVQWLPIPNNETGGSLTGYKLHYFISQLQINNLTTKQLPADPNNPTVPYYERLTNGFLSYDIKGLSNSREYTVYIIPYNSLGDGDSTFKEKFFPGFNPQTEARTGGDDNLPAIIGGVVAGVVFLVLVVILVVWCSRRSGSTNKSKYPTSYVEDAVDYPPNQGHSLYADVGSKQRNQGYNSNNEPGYPDVVANGNDYPMKNPSSNSYEQSDKAYV